MFNLCLIVLKGGGDLGFLPQKIFTELGKN